ncbi:MAG: histidine kinase [Clostridia bacterium]|nr:histidine kinase [Clostridia bacterium]
MASRKWNLSIVGRIRSMGWRIVLALIIPVVLSLTLMLVFSGRYSRSVERMGAIAALKPVVSNEIPGAVWQVVSGRETLGESRVYQLIDQVNQTIADITRTTGESDRLELVIAGRTMDTLTQYIDQIRDNLTQGKPVVTNEKVLEEIRAVAELVVSMLNDYITGEINSSAAMSVHLNRLVMSTAAVELMLALLALVLASRTAKSTAQFVREPIEKLESATARLAEGDLSVRLPVSNVEEMYNLTGQVNIMADKLDDMMQQRIRDERNLKKAELRTLQAQINPHFLYNTLDAIVWKAEAGDQGEVIQLTQALSDFFRISLSSGADWIPISQEKKHIAGYLSIQKTRYRDILNYAIDIPDEMGEFYILKLLLQPLVENALYHGIKYRRGGGFIHVTGRMEGDALVFAVKDTGRGMDPETLDALRRRLAEKQSASTSGGSGFGLVNVNLRLRLYYNSKEGLSIESGPEGTIVSFCVPRRTREEIENDQSLSG